MQTSDWLAIVALIISLASIAISFYSTFQDRPRLKLTSRFNESSEWGPASIYVTMINVGRRPVILRMLGGTDASGATGAKYLEHDKGGLRLGEQERHEESIDKEGTMLFVPDAEDIFFETMWVEDSLGNRHPIPDSRAHIKKLWP